MKEALTYFKAERTESLLFIAAGGASVLLALWFWFSVKKPFYNGLATSLAALALIQLVVGFTVYFRTPLDIKKVETFLMNDPSKIKSEELPRMENVMHAFVTYRYAEIVLAMAGLAIILYFKEPGYWKGFGAALLAQAVLMLIFDSFAENRGKVYLTFLRSFVEQ